MESYEISSLSITIGFVTFMFFVFLIVMRYIKYKETVVLAERGMLRPEPERANSNGKDTLRWGIVLTAIGLAISMGLFIDSGWDLLLLIGLLPLFFGLALILIYVLTREDKPQPQVSEPSIEHAEQEPKQD